ncbi:hypothetical protein ACRBEV_19935 [Methylobacterium phyllosphaerae]
MSLLPSAPRRAFATDAPTRTAGVTATRYEDLPPELIARGKQPILDAFDLAIVGEKAESGPIVRRYLADLGGLNGPPTVLGTNLQAAPRFAALAIHADDFDDNRREARILRLMCREQRVKSLTRGARTAALLGRPIALPPSG